jgi:hypothetical protein
VDKEHMERVLSLCMCVCVCLTVALCCQCLLFLGVWCAHRHCVAYMWASVMLSHSQSVSLHTSVDVLAMCFVAGGSGAGAVESR